MIKIILIEDEPSAMRYLKSVIEKKCKGFEVIDTAENGMEGMEKIRELRPDIVITDIKMPGMNGIEVAARVNNEFPFIYSIILSGYQDFEYTKGAIQSQVVDYLLKPINMIQLQTLLESLKQKIEADYYDKRIYLLRKILYGRNMEAWERDKYLSFDQYRAAVLRQNGLQSRFSTRRMTSKYNSVAESYLLPSDMIWNENIWTVTGRDEMELIFLCPSQIISQEEFEKQVIHIAKSYDSGYYTIAFSEVFSLDICQDRIDNLYYIINNNITIGFSQIIYDDKVKQNRVKNDDVGDVNLEARMNYLISNALYDELKAELSKLFDRWKIERPIQLYVESYLRQILNLIKKYNHTILEEDFIEIEFLLDEAIYSATTLDEVLANIIYIIDRMTKCVTKADNKIDTPAFFESIEEYLKDNIDAPHSLQSLCRRFGISQTYLSKLFRKYVDMSFNEYLTKIRIDRAKQIMTENPEMLLKDVALMVGYNDPFYFSRVFRTITGIPPSEFKPKEISI